MALLIKVEMKAENPSVPIQMFKKKRFAYTFCVQMLMVVYSTCITAYVVVYVQSVMHGSALASSNVTMPQTIVQAILGFFVGGLIGKNFKKRFRPAALLALSLYILALLILSTLRRKYFRRSLRRSHEHGCKFQSGVPDRRSLRGRISCYRLHRFPLP